MSVKPLLLAAASFSVVTGAGAAEAQSRAKVAKPTTISASDMRTAQKQHPQIIQEFGGAETGSRGSYVQAVGRRVATHSNTANGANAYTITTLNSPVMNAFAVPGGYVYITRQLMGLMNDEAEMASVLGHEVGHIAAKHSKERSTSGLLSQLGALAVGIFTGSGQLAQLAGQAAQVYTLSFSRKQEFESDTLGVRYMTAAGYDPLAAASMLDSLGRAGALEARTQGREDDSKTPTWARTHPLSADRVRRARGEAQKTGRAGTGLRNRDQFLAQIEGVMVDDDPAQGVVEGRQFLHPDLRLKFDVPQGYTIQNGTRAVTMAGQNGQAQFSTGPFNGDLRTYIGGVYRALGGEQTQIRVPEPRSTRVNGIEAAYTVAQVQTQQGVLDVGVMAYRFDNDTAFHFLTIARSGTDFGPFSAMLNSLSRMSTQEAASIRPRKIDVVTVGPRDTVASLSQRMAYTDLKTERFLTLNGLTANTPLRAGQKVKIVAYGTRTKS